MDGLGPGYDDLCAINPGVIMISITPLGQTGPYCAFKAPDIVLMAVGGSIEGVFRMVLRLKTEEVLA